MMWVHGINQIHRNKFVWIRFGEVIPNRSYGIPELWFRGIYKKIEDDLITQTGLLKTILFNDISCGCNQ